MKLLMLKLLMMISLLSTSLFANIKMDELILKYEKRRVTSVLKRQNIKLNDISITLKKDLKYNGWYGYAFNLSFKVKDKVINQKDFLFTDGTLIAPDLLNLKTKRSLKDKMYPTLSKKYFSRKHLIAGNPNAKHTIVLFSDPLCPICLDEVPGIMKKIMNNPKNIALYYYHMPLDMHPTAKTLVKASMIALKKGIKNIDYKVYNTNLSEKYKFDAYTEKNQQKVLNFFNKEFNTKITMTQIDNKKLNDKLNYDLKMADEAFVNGTPTVFFDGVIDKSRVKYEKYLK